MNKAIKTVQHKIHTEFIDGKEYAVGYKVVTEALRSLGLRKNPNIIEFPTKEWYFLSHNQIKEGAGDFGGIWVARTLSGARRLEKYMLEHYNQRTRTFRTLLGSILYLNDYRIKTDGVNMIEEIKNDRLL